MANAKPIGSKPPSPRPEQEPAKGAAPTPQPMFTDYASI